MNLAHRYDALPYFSHTLEMLLHTVLDDEVDAPPSPENALLPSVLSFLSSFPDYLDILVQCTRKTEVRSWRTLFSYLPPPQELFELSLEKGMLKTAGGYLIVLQTFRESDSSTEQCERLLQKAKEAGDWDLCKELARFLMALDDSGDTLRAAVQRMNLEPDPAEKAEGESVRLKTPRSDTGRKTFEVAGQTNGHVTRAGKRNSRVFQLANKDKSGDYFTQ